MASDSSATEVLPGLWLGGFITWYRGPGLSVSELKEVQGFPEQLFFEKNNITCVVSVCQWHPSKDIHTGLTDIEFIEVDDVADDINGPKQTMLRCLPDLVQ